MDEERIALDNMAYTFTESVEYYGPAVVERMWQASPPSSGATQPVVPQQGANQIELEMRIAPYSLQVNQQSVASGSGATRLVSPHVAAHDDMRVP